MIEADLHTHSYHSDGIYSPSEVVALGVKAGLKALALTDHDTVDGVEEALRAAPAGLEIIPGIELSATWRGREIHLLAYFIDHTDPRLKALLEPLRQERRQRAERIVAQLNGIGVPVTVAEVLDIAAASGPNSSIGRPHIADAIVRHGAARDIDEAFARYLRRGQPAFVARACLAVGEAIRLVREHHGVIVVAHPALNLAESDTEALVLEGLDGIEVAHPKQSTDQRSRLREMAGRLGLIASGGSDYHGPGRNRHEFAEAGVPMTAVEELRRRALRT